MIGCSTPSISISESSSTIPVSPNVNIINVVKVIFQLDNPVEVSLNSSENTIASVEIPYKDGYEFLGWKKEEASDLLFLKDDKIAYSSVKDIVDSDKKIRLYPVYKKLNDTIKLYEYNKADKMASIYINTENGISIDDRSLINPNEHKGKDGELPVYNYVGATLSVSDCEEEYLLNDVVAQVKVRGNYTSAYKKKPIRIKFDKKQKMLGLNNDNKFKSWVLLAEWKDSSLLRNAVANYIGNSLMESDGFYCSDYRFVKVYLNGKYNGVYCLVEQQQIDSNRINVPESKSEEDGVDTGYVLEMDGYYQNEPSNQRFTVNYSGVKSITNGFSITNDINNNAQHDFIEKVTNTIWKVIYDATMNDHSSISVRPYHTMDENGNYIVDKSITSSFDAVDKVLDISSLTNMYILHEICQDRDIGWSSFYFSIDMSKDGNKKLTFIAPWDFDYAMGNNTYSNAQRTSLANRQQMINEGLLTKVGNDSYKFNKNVELKESYFSSTNSTALYVKGNENPWFSIFTNTEWFKEKVVTRWKEAMDAMVFDEAINMISVLSEKYKDSFDENFVKWSESMGVKLDFYQPSIVSYFSTHKQAADYLSIWLKERINGLNIAIINNFSK